MSGRQPLKSPFDNLRPTILREPSRSSVTPEAEARLLDSSTLEIRPGPAPILIIEPLKVSRISAEAAPTTQIALPESTLLRKKKKDRLLLVSFRMPQALKEKLEAAAKQHEINQTDIINEAIELNLQRYI